MNPYTRKFPKIVYRQRSLRAKLQFHTNKGKKDVIFGEKNSLCGT